MVLRPLLRTWQNTSVKGLIIPDLPDEHADFITPYLKDSDIALLASGELDYRY